MIAPNDFVLGGLIEVSPGTVRNWRDRYPDFDAYIKNSRANGQMKLQRALTKAATGYKLNKNSIKEETVSVDHADTGTRIPATKRTVTVETVHVAPNVAALTFVLKSLERGSYLETAKERGDGSEKPDGPIVAIYVDADTMALTGGDAVQPSKQIEHKSPASNSIAPRKGTAKRGRKAAETD